MNVLITGGSGLIGTALTKSLTQKGHKVSILSRKKSQDSNTFHWDPNAGKVDIEALIWADSIIHLAGAGIVDSKWTKTRKKVIHDSRVETANLIYQKIKENNITIKAFISASGIGFYGAQTTSHVFVESDAVSSHYIGQLCLKWEKAALQFKELNIPVSILRTGIVFTKNGGALEKLAKPIKYSIGSPLGNGKQFIPWIHIDDLCSMYGDLLEGEIKSNEVYNAVGPEHITSKGLTKAIAHKLKRPLWIPNIPAFILKLILGKRADLVLKGSKISCEKITKENFLFKFKTVSKALEDLL